MMPNFVWRSAVALQISEFPCPLKMTTTEVDDLLDAMRSLTLRSNDIKGSKSIAKSKLLSKESDEVDLERLFLTPNQRFSDEWLNKLQQ